MTVFARENLEGFGLKPKSRQKNREEEKDYFQFFGNNYKINGKKLMGKNLSGAF